MPDPITATFIIVILSLPGPLRAFHCFNGIRQQPVYGSILTIFYMDFPPVERAWPNHMLNHDELE